MAMIKKLGESEKVPFTAHLTELRKRLVFSLGVVAVLFGLAYAVSDKLLIPFSSLIDEKLVFLSPTEAFFVHLKIAFYTALGLAVPVLLYQLWAFIAPGLVKKEKKYSLRLIVASTIFFAAGASFCYFAVLPYGIKFLLGYGGETLRPMMAVGYFVGFSLNLMLVFGVVFQLPLVVIFIHTLGLVTLDQLRDFRRYLVVLSFVGSAVITPPDVFTQVVLSLPLIALYEMSLLTIRIYDRKKIAKGKNEKANA